MYTYLNPVDDGLSLRSSGSWAKVKLDYLNRYINVFETSMRRKWPNRNYIDLLAGSGKNNIRDTGEILLGSPLLALTTKYPFSGYYFVDMDSENTKALALRCSASALREQVQIINGDCNSVVEDIVSNLKVNEHSSLNLAFLDPEGLELHWTTVLRLASVRRMDLIINYPQGGLNRYMRRAVDDVSDTRIDQFFGGREWREIYHQSRTESVSPLHRQLIDLYKGRLKAIGYKEIREDDELGDEPLMRNEKQAPLYRLIFASKHELGHDFWHAVTRRDVYGQKRLFDSY